VPVDTLQLLSPVTAPCGWWHKWPTTPPCQRRWARPGNRPAGLLPQGIGLHQRPLDDIVKPVHVRLLDYEVEIAWSSAADMPVGAKITEANLADYICGLG